MKRRQSLKVIGLSTLSAGLLLDGCKTEAKKEDKAAVTGKTDHPDRLPAEVETDKKLNAEKFFTAHELATITVLGDIIIPKDEHSGSASDAGVPEFIEFIVKDKPEHQVPMRGGLRWLDMQCLKRHSKAFADCSKEQQIELVEQIAYPDKAKPDMKQGVAFFDRMRGLTATGFFTTKMGIEDLGYVGNVANQWEGVPQDVVKKYGLENVRFDSKHDGVPYRLG
jgi:gluconate 2-dehydrogenase gamma chain